MDHFTSSGFSVESEGALLFFSAVCLRHDAQTGGQTAKQISKCISMQTFTQQAAMTTRTENSQKLSAFDLRYPITDQQILAVCRERSHESLPLMHHETELCMSTNRPSELRLCDDVCQMGLFWFVGTPSHRACMRKEPRHRHLSLNDVSLQVCHGAGSSHPAELGSRP